jgi:hypothetical protein
MASINPSSVAFVRMEVGRRNRQLPVQCQFLCDDPERAFRYFAAYGPVQYIIRNVADSLGQIPGSDDATDVQ